MLESQAQTKLIKQLKEYGFFYKASDRFRAGIPDILGCVSGRFIAIEMKINYNSPTPLQIYTLAEIAKNGGFACTVTYTNRDKKWWVMGRSFASAKLIALHIIEKAHKGDDIWE